MKVYNVGNFWLYQEAPVRLFKCELVYGANKRDRQTLPMEESVSIETRPIPFIEDGKRIEKEMTIPAEPFAVGKLSEECYVLVGKEDATDRILLMTGITGGFRGECGILDKYCEKTNVLVQCQATSRCDSGHGVVAIIENGGQLVLYSVGRWNDTVKTYANVNGGLVITRYEGEDFYAKQALAIKNDIEVI